ncbi:MAG TPA: hypothetical protein VEF76_04075 [Patescibacteria group bacterium]|nr:hypothetical protein [Patescibacteria group bacterium]
MQNDWEHKLRNMKVEEAPDTLLQRITTVVPHLAQIRAEEKPAPGAMVLRFMTELRYGLALKAACFGCVALLGVAIGSMGADEGELPPGLLFGDIGMEDTI